MSLREKLLAIEEGAQLPEVVASRTHPSGWEPGIVWDPSKGGTLTAGPFDNDIDDAIWDTLLEDWGLNKETTEVVYGSVQVRGWDAAIGGGLTKRMKYYRASLVPRSKAINTADLEALYKETRKAKVKKGPKNKGGDATLLVALSDWQAGNPDFGGVDVLIQAISDLNEAIPQRVADMRRQGYEVGSVCLAGMGDLIEGTCGHYPAQQFRVEIDRREQIKLVRRGLRDIIMNTSPYVDSLKVVAIPGNHGENRQNGKAFTTVGDNDDVAVFEQVAEIIAQNPDINNVQWRIPGDEIAITVELSGKRVAFTHGHVARGNGNAAEVLWNWWKNQAMGRAYPGVADADILVSGHYHHLSLKEQANRLVVVTPSLVSVGEYYANAAGVSTQPGTMTMLIRPDGWGELTVL